MPNIASILKAEIVRVARKEIRSEGAAISERCVAGLREGIPHGARAHSGPVGEVEMSVILAERDDGDFHIYAGAMEAVQGDGYIAAVVVNLIRPAGRAARESFRDDALACGHRWSSPEPALSYAMGKGLEAAERERHFPAR